MFGPLFFIDTFQNAKRVVTNAVITDKVLNKAANDYIDAQTAFARMLAQNAMDLAKYSTDLYTNVLFPQKA